MSTGPRGTRRGRARWTHAAVWAAVEAGTRQLAEQTGETLRTRVLAHRLATVYGRLDLPQRAGHLFELMHASAFNRDAIAKGSGVRAHVTGWTGSPTAPADIRLNNGGLVVAEAQAKLRCSAAETALDQARERYAGMQRLVASDQIEDVNRHLDKRLTLSADGVRYDEFVDARAHVTDHLHADGVGSTPLTIDEVKRAAEDPKRWADRQVAGAATRQIGTAAASGAAAGGVISGVIEAGAQAARMRAGETSVAAAACGAAGAAARGAVSSGALAGLGETLRVAAAAGLLPAGFGVGTLPTAVAGAVHGVAAAGVAFVRGEIEAGELAARSCESTLQTGMVWACGAVGQTVLPVPVVGALVGGLVGQLSAIVIAQGLQAAVAAAHEDGLEEKLIAILEEETRAAVTVAFLMGEAEQELGERRNAYVTATVGPLLDDALHAVAFGSDDALERLAELTTAFAGLPLFKTIDEFDHWMCERGQLLVLNPNTR